MNVPTVTAWNGTRVIVRTERGEFFTVFDTIAEATRFAAELRGALADAYHAGYYKGVDYERVHPAEEDDDHQHSAAIVRALDANS